jgi:hypothetical protein
MRISNGVAAAVAAVLVAGGAGRAHAYDPAHTHRWITRQAIARLVAEYPGQYDELLEYADEVAGGVEDEDDPLLDGDTDPTTLRVQRHFFRPTDESGLNMFDKQFPSSFVWATVPNDQNEWGWDDGMAAWKRGDTKRAYRTLGHMVHLIQDATVPAHTHLDIHGPPAGDDYENYCSDQTTDEYHSLLPVPPDGAPIPIFLDAHDAWLRTAYASYARNLVPGDLSNHDAATGPIAEMFPDLAWSWLFSEWKIGTPAVGAEGTGFWMDMPGLYYFKHTGYAGAIDRVSFDESDPFAMHFGPNDGSPMTANMARDLVPVAILHSAGMMKLYLDTMHATPVDPPADPTDPNDPNGAPAGGCSAAPGAHDGAAALALAAAAFLLAATRRRRSR